jgi:hypothetical protein
MYAMTKPYDPNREELYSIKDDVLPTQQTAYTGSLPDDKPRVGASSTIALDKGKSGVVPIRYKDKITEADVYLMDGMVSLVMYCPKCQNTIRIASDRKQIDWDPTSGVVSVEPSECTWELGRGTDNTRGDRIAYGMGLCRLRFVIDKNVMRDA